MPHLPKLNLPEYHFRIKEEASKTLLFDTLRKKWLTLTPEEWVRQNFIQYLIEDCHYPQGSIGVEVGIKVNGRQLRVDALVYDAYGELKILMEFKAPTIAIDEQVFSQAADYNTKVGAPYVLVSNGVSHYCAKVSDGTVSLLDGVPPYEEL